MTLQSAHIKATSVYIIHLKKHDLLWPIFLELLIYLIDYGW